MPLTPHGRSARRLGLALVCLAIVASCTLTAPDAPGSATTSSAPAPTAEPAPATNEPQDTSTPAGSTLLFVRVEFDTISDDQLAALRALDGVAAIDATRRDDIALFSSRTADGTPVDDLPADFKISLAVQVDQPDDGVDLTSGQVALTTEGLPFRALDVGGAVVLADRQSRTVAAIVDGPMVRGSEILVSEEDASALGVRPLQRLLITLTDDADANEVAAAVEQVLGDNAITQERIAEDRPIVLSLPQTKARFGEFAFKDLAGRDIQAGASWIEPNIVTTRVPIIGRVVCHRDIIEDLTAALQDVIDSGLANEIDPALYGGCWAPRRINKNANLSRHAWGIAIDLNVDFSKPGMGPIPSEGVIAAFERHGFRWGGDYPIPDNHHFEWVGP